MRMSVVTDPMSIEIPKKPANKTASEHRKATKPMMEKKRRARINHSLNELKSLILEALNKDPSRHSKLEKADILEMTVRYLQDMQRRHSSAAAMDAKIVNKFKAGFNECATEVKRYMSRIDGVDTRLKHRLIQHLSNCVTGGVTTSNNNTRAFAANVAFPGMAPPQGSNSPLRVLIPYPCGLSTMNDINNNTTSIESKLSTPPSSATSTLFTFTFPHPLVHSPVTPQTPTTPTNIQYVSQASPASSDSNDVDMMQERRLNDFKLISQTNNVWRPW